MAQLPKISLTGNPILYTPASARIGNTCITADGAHYFAPWRLIAQSTAPDTTSRVMGTKLNRAAWICKIYKAGSGNPADILAQREARLEKIRKQQKGIN